MKRASSSFSGLNLFSQVLILIFASVGLPSMSIAFDAQSSFSKNRSGNQPQTPIQTSEFREQLHVATMTSHHPLPDYTTARKVLFGQLDLQQASNGAYFIHDVYCQKDYSASDFTGDRGPKPGQAPDDHVINVEHTWPQSHFSGREADTMKVDLHHLYPANSKLNGIRGNFDFGDLDASVPLLVCNTSQIGQAADGRTVYDPPNAQKGHIARSLFYFAVRYGVAIEDHEEASLRNWNKMFPPDAYEMNRNNMIEKIQGNRNPFVDHPEYADQIANF